ncbi:non-classical arabinogalactan protein 31-like [Abeliophyllum distichum]|uniref:Non-classical arabinogalactan protein 31-like n=1 Tax=Abeliophyllum distichum TaxID=126358 RepID=A0ABD1QGW8_9LAMI
MALVLLHYIVICSAEVQSVDAAGPLPFFPSAEAPTPSHHNHPSHPPTQPPVKQPPTQPPVKQPPTQPPVKQPPTQPPVKQPPTQPPVKQPPTQPPVKQPPTQPPVKQPPTQPPVKQPPTQPPVKQPPTHPPVNPPILPPSYPPTRKYVAVQGVVYCKSCHYKGIDTLMGASPLPGASVKLQCNNTKYHLVEQATTDKNGYFFIMPKLLTTTGSHKCKVSIVSSPLANCSVPTNLHGGAGGAILMPGTKPPVTAPHPLPFQLFTVGPFAFEPHKKLPCHY